MSHHANVLLPMMRAFADRSVSKSPDTPALGTQASQLKQLIAESTRQTEVYHRLNRDINHSGARARPINASSQAMLTMR